MKVLYDVAISALLVSISGFASGMTVGMLSIDPIQLRILQDQGSAWHKKRARELEEMLAQHHLVLVTLLLANSIALEALPIFLNKCVSEVMAVALSVTLILLVGEIIPQAACTGTAQMTIVLSAVPVVQCLISGLWVLSFPIARLLDHLVGETEGQVLYARSHLKALIRLHQKETRSDGKSETHNMHSNGGAEEVSALCADEVVVIEGALDLASKTAAEIIVPIDKVYMLEEHQKLTPELRAELLAKGHSRVPVYRQHRWNVKGLLYIKSLICLDSHQTPSVGNLVRSTRPPVFCPPEMSLYDLLNEFQRGRHMAFITNNAQWHRQNWGDNPSSPLTEDSWAEDDDRALLGIATLEDVIEELIQEEIYDEFDNYNSSAACLDQMAQAANRLQRPPCAPSAALQQPPAATPTLKLSFSRRPAASSEAEKPSLSAAGGDLTERLLPGPREFCSSASGTLSNRAANKDSGGVVVVRNLKTVLGLNQARRSRSKIDLDQPTNSATAAAAVIPIKEESPILL